MTDRAAVPLKWCGDESAKPSGTPASARLTTDDQAPKQLEKENFERRRANEILKKASAYFAQTEARPPSKVMVTFVDDHREQLGVEPICPVLPIAPSTHFRRKAEQREPTRRSARAQRDDVLRAMIPSEQRTRQMKSVVELALLVAGVIVSLWAPQPRLYKWLWVSAFVVLGGVNVWLSVQQERVAQRREDSLIADLDTLKQQTKQAPQVTVTVPDQPFPRYTLGGTRDDVMGHYQTEWVPMSRYVDVRLNWADVPTDVDCLAEITLIGIAARAQVQAVGRTIGNVRARVWNVTDGKPAAVTNPVSVANDGQNVELRQELPLQRELGRKVYRLEVSATGFIEGVSAFGEIFFKRRDRSSATTSSRR